MDARVPMAGRADAPAATFEQPFEMLAACHERVVRTLDLLGRLRVHLREHGADTQARQAAQDVIRYFDQAAPQHHRDEEMHVFPPLIAQGDPAMLEVVGKLRHDHLQMESRWVLARGVLAAIAAGTMHALAADDDAALDAFASLYAGHIEAEEAIVYPAAATALGAEAVAAMGQEMRRRRGAA